MVDERWGTVSTEGAGRYYISNHTIVTGGRAPSSPPGERGRKEGDDMTGHDMTYDMTPNNARMRTGE